MTKAIRGIYAAAVSPFTADATGGIDADFDVYPSSEAFPLVRKARATASTYPLMAAMKRLEAWRAGDESRVRMAPPLVPSSADQKANLKTDFDALKAA